MGETIAPPPPGAPGALFDQVSAGRSVRIAVVGDSIAMGYFGGTGYFGLCGGRAGSWPSRLAEMLAHSGVRAGVDSWFGGGNADGLGGDGGGSGPNGDIGPSDYDPRLSFAAGWERCDTTTVGGHLYGAASGVGPLAFTPEAATDRCEVFFAQDAATDFEVLVDGDVVISHVAEHDDPQFRSIVVKSSWSGLHSYAVRPAHGGKVRVAGMAAWSSVDPGVQIMNLGWASAWTRGYSDVFSPWSPLNALQELSLDHVVLALGVNDWMSAVYVPDIMSPPEETQANLQAMINVLLPLGGVSLATPTPSCPSPPIPDDDTQARYAEAIRQVAAANGLALIDLFRAFGSWPEAHDRGWIEDPIHPNREGQRAIARLVAEILWPGKFDKRLLR